MHLPPETWVWCEKYVFHPNFFYHKTKVWKP